MFYTENQINAARHVRISRILDDMSEKYKRCGKEYYWKAHDSVKFHDNIWYQHSTGIGGSAIEFCQTFMNMDFSEAMDYLSERFIKSDEAVLANEPEQIHDTVPTNICKKHAVSSETIMMPQMPAMVGEPTKAIEYLTKERGISKPVVSFFIGEKAIMETADYHNVAFIGRNVDGEAMNIHLRSCTLGSRKFRQTVRNSDSRYGFSFFGNSNVIYAFEAPIDMLSFISLYSLNWMQNNYITLNGLSGIALCRALEEHKNLTDIVLCLDNDKAGNETCERLARDIRNMGYENIYRLKSSLKDWNEDLLEKIRTGEEVKICHQLQSY